jgi:hypothetical protein
MLLLIEHQVEQAEEFVGHH